jgi:hypothetical protein
VPGAGRSQRSISEAHARLGIALRRVRLAAGVSTRQVPKAPNSDAFFSSGHISLVEAGATAPSPELVEAYALLGGDRAELLSRYHQLLAASQDAARARRQGHQPGLPIPPTSIQAVRDRHDVQQHYVVISHRAEHVFGPNRAITEVIYTVTLRALTPGVCMYYSGHSYPADQRAGVVEISPIAHASLLSAKESSSGAVAAYFLLDRAISPNDPEPYILQFRILIHSTLPATPRLRYFTTVGCLQLILIAAFPETALPARTWWFAQPDIVAAEQAIDEHELRPGPGGRFERTFDDLIYGWCYGFAWTW